MNKEKLCICGDEESQHVDNQEQCVIPECGCKGFEEKEITNELPEVFKEILKPFAPPEKKYKYEVCDIVRSPRGSIGQIRKVDTIKVLGSNGLKPKHFDYWVYFGMGTEAGYEESELELVNLSKEKKEEYSQMLRSGQRVEENLSASESRMERSDEVSRENAEAINHD